MPVAIQGETQTIDLSGMDFSGDKNIEYNYPIVNGKELDLKPGSDLHNEIVREVWVRADESKRVMRNRYSAWKEIDRTVTAYIPTDTEEDKIKAKDERKPISIVVPVSFAAMETILTYYVSAFLNRPIFRYEGVEPSDVIGSVMLEGIVDTQSEREKVGLSLYTMWGDSLKYGFGVTTPVWETQLGKEQVEEENEGFFSPLFNKVFGREKKIVEQEKVIFEGNRLDNIDPYSYLPDPNVPIHRLQKGEYVGWVNRTNLVSLLTDEKQGVNSLFNARYVKSIDGRSIYSKEREFDKSDMPSKQANDKPSKPVDIVYMYINIIPKDWKLGDSEYPEKWLFAVAGDKIVVGAKPLGLNHNMFPVAVSAPDYDGYSLTPISRLEMVYGLQEVINWMYNSHVTNVRKSINDMFVVDPFKINMNDLANPGPGKLIRLRRPAWGSGLKDAVMQLPVNDITRNNVADSAYSTELLKSVTGAVDGLQGIMRSSGERRSATEARDTRISALSRIEKSARIASIMAHTDIAFMMASHVQQLMTNDTYVKLTGRGEEDLLKTFGELPMEVTGGRVKVNPKDLKVNWDIISHDGSVPNPDSVESWIQIFQSVVGSPELNSKFDTVRIFKHIARKLGAKDVEDFVRKEVPEVQTSVLPQEQIDSEVKAGNLAGI